MIIKSPYLNDYWDNVGPGQLGAAYSLSSDSQDDVVDRLHQTIEEITGKSINSKPKMGFIK